MWIIFVRTRPGKEPDADVTEDVAGGIKNPWYTEGGMKVDQGRRGHENIENIATA